MIGVLAALLGAAVAGDVEHLVATPPQRVLVVLRTPPAAVPVHSSADLLGAADRVFREVAHVVVVSPEQVGLSTADFDACPVEIRSSCWVRSALKASGDSALRALMLLSIQPEANGDRVAFVSFDLRSAARELEARSERDVESTEQVIWDLATRSPAETVRSSELEAFLKRRVRAELGDFLRTLASREGLGAIRIENVEAGSEVELDGRVLGVAAAREVEIDAVEKGPRRVRLLPPNGSASALDAEVDAGAVLRLDAAVSVERGGLRWRPIGIGAGAVAAAVGAGFLVAHALSGDEALCIHRGDASDCEGSVPQIVAGPGGVGAPAEERRGAPPVPAIGAGLVALGASWAIGAVLLDDDDRPWWLIAGGIVLGAAVSGASFALAR